MSASATNWVAIDTGGTFTDFAFRIDGREFVRKLPSTPDDPGRVIVETLSALGIELDGLVVLHGSTVATNTVLEGAGARTALVTTRGFADVIEIGRQDRPNIYDLRWRPPTPLVPEELRFEVDERIAAGGDIVRAIDIDAESKRLVAAFDAASVEAIAVCLLFAPENDTHERALVEALRASQPRLVVAATEVLRELREYERTSTTVISAYVAPRMERYLTRLRERLEPATLLLMESRGGLLPVDLVGGQAVRTVMSGPAGGVVATRRLAERHACAMAAFDMGGTSTDVCLVVPSRSSLTHEFRIRDLPVAIPIVDVHTVGAGGGSQAWIDAGGALRVGPQSAGAVPGPICYARGGTVPTVTDANVMIGHLPADTRLGGEMPIDASALTSTFAEFGRELGLDANALARGIVQVVEAEMTRALRRITQERGVDPRGVCLASYGGAGGLHAVSLARQLGMPRVIVPPTPGILSATGMFDAPLVASEVRTILETVDDARLASLNHEAAVLVDACRARLRAEALPLSMTDSDGTSRTMMVRRELAMRYVGQSHELDIDWSDQADPRDGFRAMHRERFGFAADDRAIEVVALRVDVEWHLAQGVAFVGDRAFEATTSERGGLPQRRSALTETTIERGALVVGQHIAGPKIIRELSGTFWLPEGATLFVASDHSLIVDVESDRAESS